jgi:succinate dehydrogenase/fumarate reductase cytochrome b subunit
MIFFVPACLGAVVGSIVGWKAAKATYRALVEPGTVDGAEIGAVIVFVFCVVAGIWVGLAVVAEVDARAKRRR